MTNSTIQQLGDAFYTAMFEAWQAEGAATVTFGDRHHAARLTQIDASYTATSVK